MKSKQLNLLKDYECKCKYCENYFRSVKKGDEVCEECMQYSREIIKSKEAKK